MKIKTIHISGFRKILGAEFNLEDNITVIAGANNSGKTSIVELFNYVFNSNGKLCCDDYPVIESQKWCTAVFPHFKAQFSAGKDRKDVIANILEVLMPRENSENAIQLSPIEVKIQVDYDPVNDDIRNFADYIMELDPDNSSFYFIYRFELDKDLLRKSLDSEYEKLRNRFDKLVGDADKDIEGIRIIKEMLILLYTNSCKDAAYFSDKTYSNIVSMELKSFRALFNYQNIMAGRTLDDGNSDRVRILSKNMIDIASQEDDWKTLIQSLPDKIKQSIEDEHIQQQVRKASVETLGNTIDQISKTNGGQAGNITIDMVVTDEAVQSLLKNITSAKYQVDDFFLRESSQGLGYSNLIFIHLQLEKYRKTLDPLLVNFFVIEEPEAHMHPQMQNVFSHYLFAYYNKESAMQGFVTTHSHEVVRNIRISQLRVLRQVKPFECCLYDLHKFIDKLIKPKQELKDLVEFYDGFYTINFPDIIFADKVILYEGDTERMLIKNALLSDKFKTLRTQYISYVQVGGAYAINYKPILDYLNIKSLIITDLDFDADAKTESDVVQSSSTNATINAFAKEALDNSSPTVQDLYSWIDDVKHIELKNICLTFQNINDHYARTLEEAMLAKRYNVSVLDTKTKEEWTSLRKSDKLRFVIPQKVDLCSIRTIVQHTSKRKTDFMYSVILNKLVDAMLPNYIEEGLMWLTD
ncbi:AAA family ATPase [Ruminococcus sp.]|uniref:AAA family ATPase n=1 Tax=Ruminococcus sp. TaxID=41978 RepID=UPI0025F242B7|nr:AAA family ATPase [Ruminococcus sp.]MBR1433297.1 AAA family ATPase [Ruminococcus sp.]